MKSFVLPVWIVTLLTCATARAAIMAGPIVNPANGHSYYLLSQNTWTASETEAMTLGGHLATINNAEENSWVYSQFSSPSGIDRGLWIGLNDAVVEGTFVWVDGSPVAYTNWRVLQPDNADAVEDFVHIHSNLDPNVATQWNDLPDVGRLTFSDYQPFGVVEIVPEPASLSLFLLPGLLLARRRR